MAGYPKEPDMPTTMANPTNRNDKATDQMNRKQLIEELQAADAYAGHSRDSVEDLRAAVRELRYAGSNPAATPTGPSQADVDAALGTLKNELESPEFAQALADTDAMLDAEAPQAATDPAERTKLAKAEHKLLKAWAADGSKPPKPATPNIDAIEADGPVANRPKARKAAGSGKRSTTRGARYQEAMAEKAKGPRGKGVAISEDDLVAYCRNVQAAAGTDADQAEWLEVAYWLDRLAVSRPRWAAAWEAAKAARSGKAAGKAA